MSLVTTGHVGTIMLMADGVGFRATRSVDERPVEAVRAAFRSSYRTAATYAQRARAEGQLPPTTAGKRNA